LADRFVTHYVQEDSGPVHASFLQCEAFLEFEWLDHAFATRHSAGWLAVNPAVTLRQIHSDQVFRVNGFTDRHCEGDALVTDQIGQRIGVRTADCVPLLIADTRRHAVAAVHAGWRGTASSIAAKTVGRIVEEFGSNPADLQIAIGAAIRVCCYEVGPEVVAQLTPFFPEWLADAYHDDLHRDSRGHRKVDLVEANRRTLIQSGVPAEQIYDGGFCTMCDAELFHSFRRDAEDPGRMVSSIVRKS
jgi:YfiH family protein